MITFLQEIIDKLSEIDELIMDEQYYNAENEIDKLKQKCISEQALWELAEETEKLGIEYK